MAGIRITASRHGTPGEIVAVEDGLVVWAGPIEELHEAGQLRSHRTIGAEVLTSDCQYLDEEHFRIIVCWQN
jgi:hypothetical protein